jgi:hypothetical protein
MKSGSLSNNKNVMMVVVLKQKVWLNSFVEES